jgi:hypothetical protein
MTTENADEPLPFKYDRFEDCPDAKKHTKQPDGYVSRAEWAERKLKTHDCTQCPTCGFWVIWRRKRAA